MRMSDVTYFVIFDNELDQIILQNQKGEFR